MTRRLVVTEDITVDGVIDMSGRWFDPLSTEVEQSDMAEVTAARSAAADALLVGRNTFEAFREFWPKQTDDPTGVSTYLDRVAKYVLSTTMADPGWRNSTVLRGPLVEEVRALKQAPGRDIVATGSIRLVHALIEADLVDESRLFVFPVLVGKGARLPPHSALRLAHAFLPPHTRCSTCAAHEMRVRGGLRCGVWRFQVRVGRCRVARG